MASSNSSTLARPRLSLVKAKPYNLKTPALAVFPANKNP